MLYKCPECGALHNTNEWNESTKREFGEYITRIDKCKDGYHFTCPSCNMVVRRREIIETKNKRDIMKSDLLRLAN